jgi:hypothetical protein
VVFVGSRGRQADALQQGPPNAVLTSLHPERRGGVDEAGIITK